MAEVCFETIWEERGSEGKVTNLKGQDKNLCRISIHRERDQLNPNMGGGEGEASYC